MKKILIIGCGNVGTALAADLSIKNHKICILKSSNKKNENFEKIKKEKKIKLIENNQEMDTSIDMVTDKFEDAFIKFNPNIVIVTVQTNYHESIVKKICKYVNHNQMIMFLPGYLSTCYMLKYKNNSLPIIIEAESSPIDCRVILPGEVNVLYRNVRNPIGVYPSNKTKETIENLIDLNLNYVETSSVVEAALHNPNLIVHTIGAIMSIPRIEYSDKYSMYKEVFTPSIYNLVDALDIEKMNVLEALGVKKLNYFDACCYRNSNDLNIDSKSVFIDYARNKAPDGPDVSNSRYITEDVPEGLVLLESIGKIMGIETYVTSSLITISEACLNVNFREKGRTIEKLGIENLKKVLSN